MREASEDGASTTSRKRKEPARDHDGGRERERDSHRDRGKDYEKDSRSSKHYHRGGHDADYDGGHGHRSSSRRDYGKDRDKDYVRDDKDYNRSSKRHDDKDDGRRRDRDGKGANAFPNREWDDIPRGETRDRSTSVRGEDKVLDERAEKARNVLLRFQNATDSNMLTEG